MKSVNDKYDFKQPSRSGKFGFETFRHDKDKFYYFHFNDHNGKAFLFSQAYRDSKSRNHGIHSVVENARKANRYLKEETPDGKFFFILKAGNNHEIARSHEFESRQEMLSMLELLSTIDNTVLEQHLYELDTPAKATKKGKSTRPSKSPKKPVQEDRLRYRFTLTFYPDTDLWVAKNDSSDRGTATETGSISMARFDGEKLYQFIQSQIPEKPISAKGKKALPPNLKGVPMAKDAIKKLTLKTTDGKIRNHQIRRKDFSKVTFKVVPISLKVNQVVQYDTKVFAKSLKDYKALLIGEVIDQFPQDGQIEIPVIANQLQPGVYRLFTQVTLEDNEKHLEELERAQVIIVN